MQNHVSRLIRITSFWQNLYLYILLDDKKSPSEIIDMADISMKELRAKAKLRGPQYAAEVEVALESLIEGERF